VITFKTDVRIERPLEEVIAYVSGPREPVSLTKSPKGLCRS
jgi:ligand-binding SRPBCC domain-containing protein